MDLLLKRSEPLIYSNPKLALTYAREAGSIAQRSAYDLGYCRSLNRLSAIYYVFSDLKNAMEAASNARSIAEKHDFRKEYAVATDGMGVIYYELGEESKSSDCFFASLKIYEGLGDKEGLGQTYCRIGKLYFNQKDYNKAVEYYENSIALARELDNKEGIASNLNSLAGIFVARGRYDSALYYFHHALELTRLIGNTQLEASDYLSIASVYLKLERYDSAADNARFALGLYEKIGNQLRIAKSKLTLGEIYLARKQFGPGLGEAEDALGIGMSNRFRDITFNAAGLLHRIYLAKKDTARAYQYSILENQWKDSLSLGEKEKNLVRLDLQYSFEKKEQLLKVQRQRRDFFILLLVICVIFSIIVIFLLRARYRLNEKKSQLMKKNLEQELVFKKKELTLNVMSLMKKNEILTDITTKLLEIAKESQQDETRMALKKIARELQKSTDDEFMKEFSLRFKEVHSDFYESLLRKFPGLTPSELKLCAFLRLNMSTKEISELTGQRTATLENARYRLRQKLGISSSDINLVTFLSQI